MTNGCLSKIDLRTDTIPHPVAPVFCSIATEVRSADAARDAVEAAGEGFVDLLLTGDGHVFKYGFVKTHIK